MSDHREHEDDVLQDFGDVLADENEMIPASRYYDLIGEFSNLMKDKQRLRNQVAEMSDEIEGYQTFLQKAFEVIQQQQEQVEVLIRGESVEKISLIDFDNIMGPSAPSSGHEKENMNSTNNESASHAASIVKSVTNTPLAASVNRLSVNKERESSAASPSGEQKRHPSAILGSLGTGYAAEIGGALQTIDELLAQTDDLRTKDIRKAMGNLKKVVDYGVSEVDALAQTKQAALNDLIAQLDRKKVVQGDVQEITSNLKKIESLEETNTDEYDSMREKILIRWESVCARLRAAMKEESDVKSMHSVARNREMSLSVANQSQGYTPKNPTESEVQKKTTPEKRHSSASVAIQKHKALVEASQIIQEAEAHIQKLEYEIYNSKPRIDELEGKLTNKTMDLAVYREYAEKLEQEVQKYRTGGSVKAENTNTLESFGVSESDFKRVIKTLAEGGLPMAQPRKMKAVIRIPQNFNGKSVASVPVDISPNRVSDSQKPRGLPKPTSPSSFDDDNATPLIETGAEGRNVTIPPNSQVFIAPANSQPRQKFICGPKLKATAQFDGPNITVSESALGNVR